jgi:AcrR family transcriptional regulator
MNAVVSAFSEKGYHGTSLRDIAQRAGLSLAAFYQHFDSKYAALFYLMTGSLTRLRDLTETAVGEAGADPAERLTAAVRAHVLVHAERRERSLIGNSELRSLDDPEREVILRMRREHAMTFRAIVEDGVAQGVFLTPHPGAATRAILTMCTAVAQWFDPAGPDSAGQVAEQYAALALATAQYRPRP